MAWENFKVEEQRLQVIKAYINKEASMTAICERYGISPKTAYKWYKRYLELGKEGLYDLSKAPHKPYCRFTEEQIQRALELKRQRLTWGPKKILAKLLEIYPNEKGHLDVYYGPVFLGKISEKGLERPKIKTRRPR